MVYATIEEEAVTMSQLTSEPVSLAVVGTAGDESKTPPVCVTFSRHGLAGLATLDGL